MRCVLKNAAQDVNRKLDFKLISKFILKYVQYI